MKSIMEQASSIIKAIEKAWINADKPKEFSVKIFENEEKNFFGMTTKPAKIGIFFPDKAHSYEKNSQKPKPEIKEQRIEQQKTHPQRPAPVSKHTTPENKHIRTEKQTIAPAAQITKQDQLKQPLVQQASATWSSTMIDAVSAWLNKTLTLMGLDSISFTHEITGKILKLTFSKPLIENAVVEKQMFRSIAHLVMASLRNQYKQEIKDLKIVLIRPQ